MADQVLGWPCPSDAWRCAVAVCVEGVDDRLVERGCGDAEFGRDLAAVDGEGFGESAAVAVTVKDQPPATGYGYTLLIRRSVADPSEIEFFLAHAHRILTPIPELIAVAGMRWKIEENNGQGKDLLGLDQYQVRKWTPWTGT